MAENILPRVPGEWVKRAACNPDENAQAPRAKETVLDVPGIGRVRFFCEWKEHKVHRNVLRWWAVKRAELEEAPW